MDNEIICPQCQKQDCINAWHRSYDADTDTVEIVYECTRCGIDFSVYFDNINEDSESE